MNTTVNVSIYFQIVFKPECKAYSWRPSASVMGIHPEGNNLFFKKNKQMAVAHSIFTLDGWVQLFWAAFYMPVTVVPLKVALWYKKIVFFGISKKKSWTYNWHSLAWLSYKEWSGEITL